jgi:hypothetical protein
VDARLTAQSIIDTIRGIKSWLAFN